MWRRALIVLLILLVGGVMQLRLRYGGGETFPERTIPSRGPAPTLEVVAELDTPPGNIAVSGDGRIFVSLHPEARPVMKLVELRDGQPQPYPSAAFLDCKKEPRCFREVLGIRIDRQNRLWTLDTGRHGQHRGRLMAFDLGTGAVVHEVAFPRDIAGLGSHLNDFQVRHDGKFLFIAEASFFGKTPALIVYDVERRRARRVLEGHESVVAEKYTPVVEGRRMSVLGLVAIRPGVDSIALDRRGEWLYFAPVSNTKMYRARLADLLDENLKPRDLEARVEVYADKTMSDGLTTDEAGNLYISDLEHSAIVLMKPDRTMEQLVRDPKLLRWPDGFSFGPDGWLYVAPSALQEVIGRTPGNIRANAPYPIVRFKAEASATPGH